MHYVCEVLLPPMPIEDVFGAVEKVLAPFSEHQEPDEDGYRQSHTFWDWWVIGGRFSTSKLTASLDQKKLQAFYDKLAEMEITVSSIISGKQNIQPENQIPAVDAAWQKFFPEWDACPLFAHYDAQYSDAPAKGDIMKLGDVSEDVSCYTLLIAATFERKHKSFELEAKELFSCEVWNGCTWQRTDFDGKVLPMIELYKKKLFKYADEYRERNTPTKDWLLVTVDYHS
jgi:hypothetical protein